MMAIKLERWLTPTVLRNMVLVGFILLASGIALALFEQRSKDNDEALHYRDDIVWYSSRFEAELLRFAYEIDRYEHETDGSWPEVRKRFDILWSRIKNAGSGAIGKALLEMPGAREHVALAEKIIDDIEPLLPAMERHEALAFAILREKIGALVDPLHELTTASTRQRVADTERERQESSTFLLTVAMLTVGLILFAITLLVLIQIDRRRIEKNRDELEERVAERTQELVERNSLQVKLNDELARANENLSQFAQIASHDLQEPLRKIALYSELLAQQIGDDIHDDVRNAIRVIQQSARRERVLVSDLLSYSKNANKRLDLQNIDLYELFSSDLQQDLSLALAETNGIIRVHRPLPTVFADRTQVMQLFRNLIGNAVKYRSNDRQLTIEISAHPIDPTHVQVMIEDNGIGFDNQFADIIFQPFKRLHRDTEYPGTGIGLALCRNIADRHNWKIQAIGSPGKGAVITIDVTVAGPD